MAYHNELGKIGEKLAAEYLINKGYEILAQNFYFDKAEIDIISKKDNNILVVVEVKTRNSDFFGDPQGFVTPSKIKRLKRLSILKMLFIISNKPFYFLNMLLNHQNFQVSLKIFCLYLAQNKWV